MQQLLNGDTFMACMTHCRSKWQNQFGALGISNNHEERNMHVLLAIKVGPHPRTVGKELTQIALL